MFRVCAHPANDQVPILHHMQLALLKSKKDSVYCVLSTAHVYSTVPLVSEHRCWNRIT
jgi:hypothetical protein